MWMLFEVGVLAGRILHKEVEAESSEDTEGKK